MADYYPLIARAVSGLEKSTGEARRTIYDRARNALLAQLSSVDPPLSDSDITRERLALEEAIRKVEAEAARKARTEPPRPEPPKVRAPDPKRWEAAAKWDEPVPQRFEEPAPPVRKPPRPPEVPTPSRGNASLPWPEPSTFRSPFSKPSAPSTPPDSRDLAQGSAESVDHVVEAERSEPEPPAPRLPSAKGPSLFNFGLRGFRSTVSEADRLGDASAEAVKSARETFDSVGDSAELDRADKSDATPEVALSPEMLESSYASASPAFRSVGRATTADRLNDAYDDAPHRPRRSFRELIRIASVLIVVLCVGGLLTWQWPAITLLYRWVTTPTAFVETPKETQPATRPKIADRLDPGAPQPQVNSGGTPASLPGAAVAQRVVLYEEDPADPQGKRFVGSAIWRTETISPGPGKSPELAIRADIEIPERKLAMTWSLRRNTDTGLPATHTVEIMFKLPPDFPAGKISNVPGILMKQSEQTRGVPLAGLAVRVTDGFFLIGLSANEGDRERNLQLLKERSWLDIPVVYANNRRAILALEKGNPGERAFADAFQAWGQ